MRRIHGQNSVFAAIDEMIGQMDYLAVDTRQAIEHYKAEGLDFSRVLEQTAEVSDLAWQFTTAIREQDHGLAETLDRTRLDCPCAEGRAGTAGTGCTPSILQVRNTNRTVRLAPCFPASRLPERHGARRGYPKVVSTSTCISMAPPARAFGAWRAQRASA